MVYQRCEISKYLWNSIQETSVVVGAGLKGGKATDCGKCKTESAEAKTRIKHSFSSFVLMQMDQYKSAVKRLCENHKVKKLFAFGSVLTDRFTDESDIDLIVDFEPISVEYYADNYFQLKFSLQDLFQRKVDLLEEKALKNPFFLEAIKKQRQIVYEH